MEREAIIAIEYGGIKRWERQAIDLRTIASVDERLPGILIFDAHKEMSLQAYYATRSLLPNSEYLKPTADLFIDQMVFSTN
ncbi:MAG: hypothetical protein GY838_13515 [bacterium]|nr:hypothetical protein [bacterium]